MKRIHVFTVFLFSLLSLGSMYAQTSYKTETDIYYKTPPATDAYEQSLCTLDLYYPTDVTGFPTLVWIHGGGLEEGDKFLPVELMNKGMAVVSINYRLSPKVKNPVYIDDAAAALAWTFKHIEAYGGDKKLIFITGHSAGAYLTLMLGLDKSYLAAHGVNADDIAMNFPISGQTMTHYTIRKERGLPIEIPVIDKYAPSNQARMNAAPIVLITGDRALDMPCRYEENAHLVAVLKWVGEKRTKLYELQGFDHSTMLSPAFLLVVDHIKKFVENK